MHLSSETIAYDDMMVCLSYVNNALYWSIRERERYNSIRYGLGPIDTAMEDVEGAIVNSIKEENVLLKGWLD